MKQDFSRRAVLSGAAAMSALFASAWGQSKASPSMQALLDYVQGQKTTGFLVIQDRKILVERNWPAPADDAVFKSFAYERTPDGELLEDVASQQKSFVSMLAAVAIDKGLLDIAKPVSTYIGAGWSKSAAGRESQIRVVDVLTMSSGLKTDFTYDAPPGTSFLYNTPVYAVIKQVLPAAAKQSLDTVTRDWLTAPAGMNDTSWRKRPAALGDVGNPTGLVTGPRDVAKFGQIVLDGGKAADGTRIVSEAQLNAMFARSEANPAYGRLWWLNGSAYAIKPPATRIDGPLIPAAPSDLVAALGALDRKLYVSPGNKHIVIRMGAAAPDKDFDQQLWLRLAAVDPR